MPRTSTVVVSLVGLVLLVLAILGLVYGPNLYREGKAFVGPIVELSRSEDALAALDAEMPFEPPADGVVAEDRFQVFLDIRRELLPRYTAWHEMEQRLEAAGDEDWQTAKEVLGQVREVAAAQRAALAAHRMPPAEFNWIEDRVYGTWAAMVSESGEKLAIADAVRRTTHDDLAVLDDLERRYGATRATRELRAHLEERLDTGEQPVAPEVEGISSDNARLFWANRDAIAELDLERYSELHDLFRGSSNVEVTVGDQ